MTGPSLGNKISKSELTKQKIIETYLNMIPSKKWDKITVKELCAEAAITRGTFYLYFNDIYDLMERIETTLLNILMDKYNAIRQRPHVVFSPEHFEEKFDYAPPEYLRTWFQYCKEHKRAITVLLDPDTGDHYFVQKLKGVLKDYINNMMDDDGMPHDGLREHFVKIFLELHFLSVRTWLTSDETEFLSVKEIINLLNTMRVGANYLSYRRLTSPDFEIKMKISESGEDL